MMNKFFFILLFNTVWCTAQDDVATSEPYQVTFDISKVNDSIFTLHTKIEIDSLSYMASVVNKSMSGIFKIKASLNPYLSVMGSPKEKACPIVTNFVWSNSPQKVIVGKVEYQQTVKISSKEEFDVEGVVQFVIEPRCTLEKIPFRIMCRKGILSIYKN